MSLDVDPEDQSKWTPKRVLIMLGFLAFLGYLFLEQADNSTELLPDHSEISNACFWMGSMGALLGVLLVLLKWKKLALAQKVVWPFCAAVLGFLITFSLLNTISELVENHIDFPANKTCTFQTHIAISRAYQTHGKNRSWNIQTMPIWSNMRITETDYKFMLSHRSPDDLGQDPDEITSRGFFCAKVTAQRAGDALRILHAGRQTLPEGTVTVCSAQQHEPA